MKFIKAFLIVLTVFLTSCGIAKRVAESGEATAQRTKVIKSHKEAALDFKTMSARVGVDYKDDKQSQSVTVDLRMENGQQIWMSARVLGLTMAKVHITRDKVRFYEKLNNKSFDGDFSLISNFLGEQVTYDQVQDILLGQAVESLDKKDFNVVDNNYQFTQGTLILKLFKLRPLDYKVSEQSIKKPSENSYLNIQYPDYQIVDGKILPLQVNIDALKDKRSTRVSLEFKNVEFDKSMSFPFDMPSNTKPIQF